MTINWLIPLQDTLLSRCCLWPVVNTAETCLMGKCFLTVSFRLLQGNFLKTQQTDGQWRGCFCSLFSCGIISMTLSYDRLKFRVFTSTFHSWALAAILKSLFSSPSLFSPWGGTVENFFEKWCHSWGTFLNHAHEGIFSPSSWTTSEWFLIPPRSALLCLRTFSGILIFSASKISKFVQVFSPSHVSRVVFIRLKAKFMMMKILLRLHLSARNFLSIHTFRFFHMR